MSKHDRISRRLSQEAAKAAPQGYGGWYNAGPAFTDAFRTRRAPSMAELVEAYKSIAYACAQINAGAVVKTPLRLYATTAGGQATPKGCRPAGPAARARTKAVASRPDVQKYLAKAERVDEVADHPLLRAIVNPNPEFDQVSLLKYTCLCLDVVGSAYWVPDAFRLGAPTELWPIQAQYVFPLRQSGRLTVDAWQYFGQTYEPRDIIRFRMVSLKDPYGTGYAPMQAAFEHARLHDSYTSVQDSLLGQGVRPSVIVSPKDANQSMGDKERARFEQDINRRLSGGGTGRAWVTDGSIDVHPLTFPPSDLAAMQISDDALERFANCFGVPLALLQTESVNLANLEAGLKQHAQQAVEPRCVEIAGALTRWIHLTGKALRTEEPKDRGWDRLFFAFDDPVGEDQERKAKVFDLDLKNGSRTINEVRTERGDEPVEWGDEPWLPSTVSQPSDEKRKMPPQLPGQPPKPGDKPEKPKPDAESDPEAADKGYHGEREDDADPFRVTKSPPHIAGGDAGADDEGGEENTYDLPDGAPLRKALERWYAKQLKAVLAGIPPKFEDIGLAPSYFNLSSWDRSMGDAMTPLLSLYWDEAGKGLREVIGLDPDAWQVTDPRLAETIGRQTFAFCESTNASTGDALQRAHERLREQIRQGVLEEGEALPKLTRRIKDIYAGLTDKHAELIAITETNRAVHLASLESARQSGVVAGKRPLISSNACPLCHRIVDEVNEKGSLPLDADFAVVGSNPTYSHMKVPPFHPRCRCSYTTVLTPEYEALIPADSPYWANAGKAVPPGAEAKVDARLKRAPKVEKSAAGDAPPMSIAEAIKATTPKPRKPKAPPEPGPAADFGTDSRAAEAWGQEAFREQFAALDQPEKDAILAYTGSSTEINEAMRGSLKPDPAVAKIIRRVEAALARTSVPESVVAYRGVRDHLASQLKKLNPGDEFTQASFCSTSLSRKIAEDFAAIRVTSRNVVLRVRVPAGANGLYVNAGGEDIEGGYSAHVHERELLLPAGSTFRVVAVRGGADYTEIEAELIPDGR